MKDRLTFHYDREADVLYVSKRHPEFTDYLELDDDFILRLDPKTKEVVGFTIIDFAARFTRKEPPISLPLKATFEHVRKTRKAKVVAESKATYAMKRSASKSRRAAA